MGTVLDMHVYKVVFWKEIGDLESFPKAVWRKSKPLGRAGRRNLDDLANKSAKGRY